ncbi:MAG TPA: endonuclease/exonuclease/phosphatase family protein [Candidatus Paceibacterota bacterium]|nr:endonuclease/exonuclease/phosphatase family protein [Candidatus Paceibacterota bacterium]
MKRLGFMIFTFSLLGFTSIAAETFRVAAYNVENYLDQPTESRHFVKSAEAKAKVRESIETLNPDVIALEEMGTTNALMELRASLKAEGRDFPFWDYVEGTDTNIHVAVLSKFPIIARRPHTNDEFLLDGKRFRVERGFAEMEIQAATNFTFTLIAAHLKSRLAVPDADQAEERLGEARVLRGIIDKHFEADPEAKLIVLGDFNDTKDSDPAREIIGHGKFKLTDTRPAERNGDDMPDRPPYLEPRNVAWTYFYGADDTYSRVDYILLSPAMARDWVKAGTYVPAIPNWGVGSDHRPIVATFEEK